MHCSPTVCFQEKGPVNLGVRLYTEPVSRGTERNLIMEATAYTHTGNKTFAGTWPRVGTIAVDPKVIPLGSAIWVEGYGWGRADDTGGLIRGQIIDVFMETQKDALAWGRRQVRVRVIGGAQPGRL